MKIMSVIFFVNWFEEQKFKDALLMLSDLGRATPFELIIIADSTTSDEFIKDVLSYQKKKKFANFCSVKILTASQELSVTRAFEQGINTAVGDYCLFLSTDLVVNFNLLSDLFQSDLIDSNADVISLSSKKNVPSFLKKYFQENVFICNELNEEVLFSAALSDPFLSIYSRAFLQKNDFFKNMEDFYSLYFQLRLLTKFKLWVHVKSNALELWKNTNTNWLQCYNLYFQIVQIVNDKTLQKVFFNKSSPFYSAAEFVVIHFLFVEFTQLLRRSSIDKEKVNFFLKLFYNFMFKYFVNYTENKHLKTSVSLARYVLKFKPTVMYIDKNFPDDVLNG